MANKKPIEEDILENEVVEETTEDTTAKEIEESVDKEIDSVGEIVEDAPMEESVTVDEKVEDEVKEDEKVEDISETSIVEDSVSDTPESEEVTPELEVSIKVEGYVPFKGISAKLYPTSVSEDYTEFVPDGAYIWNEDICNGRIRVCKSSDMKSLSGWVSISDLDVSK